MSTQFKMTIKNDDSTITIKSKSWLRLEHRRKLWMKKYPFAKVSVTTIQIVPIDLNFLPVVR